MVTIILPTVASIILPNCGNYYSTFSMRWTILAPTHKWDHIQEEQALSEMVCWEVGYPCTEEWNMVSINWRLKPRHNCETIRKRNRRNTSGNRKKWRFRGKDSKLPRDKRKIRQTELWWSIRFLAQRNNQPGSEPKVGQIYSWLFV